MPKQLSKGTTPERLKSTLTKQFPNNGGRCNHRGPCFRTRMPNKPQGYDGHDTHHHLDEGGAVLFAMQHSRNLRTTMDVYGPDGKLIVTFQPRTYSREQAEHALTEYNENRLLKGDTAKQKNDEATAARSATIKKSLAKSPPTKTPPTKTLPKKKVLKRS